MTPDDASTFDFRDGQGPVPAHRHTHPDGSEGGWVANTAQVYGNAHPECAYVRKVITAAEGQS